MEEDVTLNATGSLLKILSYFNYKRICLSRELVESRLIGGISLTDNFVSGDMALYDVEGGVPVIYLATAKNNLIFRDASESILQISERGYYSPKKEDSELVKKADSTSRFILSDLFGHFYASTEDFSYFRFNLQNLKECNASQKRLVDLAFGNGKGDLTFIDSLVNTFMGGDLVKSLPISMFAPDTIKKYISKNNKPIVSLCTLGPLNFDSPFSMAPRDIKFLLGNARVYGTSKPFPSTEESLR